MKITKKMLIGIGAGKINPTDSEIRKTHKEFKELTLKALQTNYHHKAAYYAKEACEVINKLTNGYGVEYFITNKGNGYWYVNQGETYAKTLLFPDPFLKENSRRKYPFVWTWGDVVEKEDLETFKSLL